MKSIKIRNRMRVSEEMSNCFTRISSIVKYIKVQIEVVDCYAKRKNYLIYN